MIRFALTVCVIGWTLGALPVMAAEKTQNSQISPAEAHSPWVALIITLVLVLAVLVGSFKSARRSHQD